jgi:hypothetical protein
LLEARHLCGMEKCKSNIVVPSAEKM